jgi:hypothetical protein
MRYVFALSLLAALLALPALTYAQSNSTLPISGTVTSNGTLSGTTTTTIGGVTGTLTSSGGTWTMTVGGVLFASGTYSCSGGSCTYTGTIVGSKTTLSFTTNKTTGTITSATGFSTHGAWVSAVAQWAGAHQGALTAAGLTVGQVVSGAAKIEGSLASSGHGGGSAGDHAGGHGRP